MLPCYLKTRLGGIIFGICLRAKEKSGKILLNITGGGYNRLKADYKIKQDRGADGDKIVGAIGA